MVKVRKNNRKSLSGSIFGLIKNGTYIPFPEVYFQKHEEAKSLLLMLASSCKKTVKSADFQNYVMETLVKYQNNLISYQNSCGVEPDFFDKVSSMVIALVNTSRPIVGPIDDNLKIGNRCNTVIAVEFAIRICKHPEMIQKDSRIVPLDFEKQFDKNLKVIKKDLARTLNHNPKDPMPFTCKLMDNYIKGLGISINKRKDLVKSLN